MQTEITPEEKDAILQAVDYSLDDQQTYLNVGDLRGDYGDEWQETCQRKAENFRHMASLVRKCGAIQMAEDAERLAGEFEARKEEK